LHGARRTQVVELLPDAPIEASTEASSDAAATMEAASDAPISTAGKIACGSAQCTTSSMEYCCVQGGDGGASLACETSGGSCAGGRIECDESADCAGQVCCFEPAQPVVQSSCHVDCTGGGGTRVQACRSTSECATCQIRQCSGGFTIKSCAPIPGICP
jgi:hypothetical protein